jgi:hypothetical protein
MADFQIQKIRVRLTAAATALDPNVAPQTAPNL